ncbi:hypothetical protein GTA08_BOTSDO08381 [Neofusicoccum parvum]|uniref:Uncharacterized protein n=1 Tax=Neofusicoccum parvum TaxID=310453 RepID=A0ACB5S3W1_9PEZI|nr:hypothetical protein GTA08_BOTSDO08381 [Neofusicoccum parvum]
MPGGGILRPETKANADCYSKWTVETDGSVGLTCEEDAHLPKGSIAWAVELKTRIFSVQEDDWIGEITHVLQVLHSKLDGRILVNDSCGMHVHVGRKATATSPARFDVRTIKNLFQLVTVFERQIEELHTEDRIISGDRRFANFCRPLSEGFQEYQEFGPGNPLLSSHRLQCGTPLTWCETIEGIVHELEDLNLITRDKRHVAYNFLNTTPLSEAKISRENSQKWTVEFRQHRGTLDADEVFAWLGFVLSAVQYAETTSFQEHQELLVARVEDPQFTIFDLLKAIGAPAEVTSYYEDALMLARMELAKLITQERSEGPTGLYAAIKKRIKAMMNRKEADKEAQLRGLFKLVNYQRLKQSAFRRRAIAQKLEHGYYGNFEYELKRKLLAAVVHNELSPVVEYDISQAFSDEEPSIASGKS